MKRVGFRRHTLPRVGGASQKRALLSYVAETSILLPVGARTSGPIKSQTLNHIPYIYITHYCSFHFLFHFSNITPTSTPYNDFLEPPYFFNFVGSLPSRIEGCSQWRDSLSDAHCGRAEKKDPIQIDVAK